ncbi:LacI family DNA-binding transcriptional regulator [Rubrivirga litoralis]|uniref:LacI family DNA-binding transcriptional regulator n=1 Tax=Rubrivirga litoralis TaxID=3075598 RepID=A0ABU3BSJ3_9BACT|nr:LacI family DNA-binding transcriptional regulator [Rubrivirga sp. F394]MDT0632264.1 LacI family DNA-binding transcriptional regulator [Rubrivirga sp. F394]
MAVTIYDIADEAHVSIATVSRVFNEHPRVSEDTRRRVFRVAERMGYEPHTGAQSLARKGTNLVSAVVPVMTSFFFMEVLRGAQGGLDGSPYDLLVYPSRTFSGVDAQLGRALQRGRSDGLLLVSVRPTPDRVRRLQATSQAVVLVDDAHEAFDSITVDSRWGGRVAVEHLIERGHERVGLLLPVPGTTPGDERLAGYHDALAAAGREPDPDLVVSADWHHDLQGFTRFAGYRAMQVLLDRFADRPAQRPTAVFVAADIMAFGALRAAHEAGLRVPGDLDVVGFDDVDASAYLGLTTLHQPMVEMGQLATEKLRRRLDDPGAPPSHTVFAPRLVVRETTGGAATAPSA